ncbi:unnamed protein product [Lepeophtheirus salmonis]|uniref:(salmon louse) hypothetical protein n=1 Tax=Lepeophtheirus salmonis TaxID=72036 RepID=A0A7R8CNL6_LEPSM|nr:unnamed protein product [Lepeophtheirus salmonis]CAF2876564.1 unnamed protein product [Lepeophtheirus salmonis]
MAKTTKLPFRHWLKTLFKNTLSAFAASTTTLIDSADNRNFSSLSSAEGSLARYLLMGSLPQSQKECSNLSTLNQRLHPSGTFKEIPNINPRFLRHLYFLFQNIYRR